MESRKPSKLPARTIAWLTAGFLGIALFIAFIKLPPKPEVTIPPTYTPTHTPTATSISTPTVTPTSTLTPTPGIGSTMRGADGAILVFVPAGEFTMGSNIDSVFAECQKYRTDCKRDWFTDEESPHIVNLNAFWIDQTEVTNEMYAKCVDAGKCTPPSNTDHFSNSDYGNHPVVYVDWNDANTYCSWAERRLPTEAEWEKAARGTDGRTYPWGENIDINFANYDSSVGGTSPVGSYESGKSPYAVYDMAGNVWEWVNDWYSETYYQVSPLLSPVGPDMGIDGIIRGGSWGVDYYEIRSSSRSRDSRNDADIYIGFRCARSQ